MVLKKVSILAVALVVSIGALYYISTRIQSLEKTMYVSESSRVSDKKQRTMQHEQDVPVECDYNLLKQQADEIMNVVDIDQTYWTKIESINVEQSEKFGWTALDDVRPCAHRISYVSPQQDTVVEGFEQLLRDELLRRGWSNATHFEFVSDDSGAPVSITLAHADGPLGGATIFTQVDRDAQTVQFARIQSQSDRKNFIEYREGRIDMPCPCQHTVSFEISGRVHITSFPPGVIDPFLTKVSMIESHHV